VRAGLKAFALCVAALLLAGCAAFLRLEDPPSLQGISPAILGERTVEQRLSLRWPGEERSVEAVLEIASGKLKLVTLAMGMRLSTLEYDGVNLGEIRHVPQVPPGKRMVRDLFLIATPLAALSAALPENWSVTENNDHSPRLREIRENGNTRIMIRYFSDSPWQGKVEFEHRALGYQLILDSHEP
jgi:hypothetical protein